MEQKKPIILFLPEAGIHPYVQTVSAAGSSFLQEGHPVYLIDCNGFLDRCPMQASYGHSRMFSKEEKRKLCDNCTKSIKKAAAFFGFKILPLSDYITDETIHLINSIFPEKIMEYEKIEFNGCKIGKLAIHDLMIETKILNVSEKLGSAGLRIYQGYIISMARIIAAIEIINKKLSPMKYISFNPYSQNQAVRYAAEKFNSSFAMISNKQHCGANWQLLEYDGSLFKYNRTNSIELWNENNSLSIPPLGISAAFEDFIYRMSEKDSHIFSSSRNGNIDAFIKNNNLNNKIILTAFTSSQDEMIGHDLCAAEWGETIDSKVAFKTQIEWIQFLKNFVQRHNDVFCIIRIHPREARDGGSEHLKLLKETFQDAKAQNFLIVWPEDPISSYDLMEITDVCLVSLSTTGLECMRLGIPMITYSSKRGYVNDGYVSVSTDITQYEETLNKIIRTDFDYKYLLNAARFYYWQILMQSFFLGKNIPRNNLPYGKLFKISKKTKSDLYDILTNKISLFDYNFNKLIKAQNSISNADELHSLRSNILVLVNSLFGSVSAKQSFIFKVKKRMQSYLRIGNSKNKSKKFKIIYISDMKKFNITLKTSWMRRNTIFIFQDDIYSYRIFKGKCTKHISKAISRLIKMYMTIPI